MMKDTQYYFLLLIAATANTATSSRRQVSSNDWCDMPVVIQARRTRQYA